MAVGTSCALWSQGMGGEAAEAPLWEKGQEIQPMLFSSRSPRKQSPTGGDQQTRPVRPPRLSPHIPESLRWRAG